LKSFLKPLYDYTHDLLFDQMAYHPFFPKNFNGKKITTGFISDEHLNYPSLDEQLLIDLKQHRIETGSFAIDISSYKKYLAEASYPASYYGGGLDPQNNFTEKTLEHFVSLSFLNPGRSKVLIDVAAATSPFMKIIKKKYGLEESYQQDLIYPPGIHDDKIGGYAHEIPLPDNSVDIVSLHCSLEHFENDSDIRFFKTLERILKPGGKCVVLPFYIARKYTIHLDPAFNLLKFHHPMLDPLAEIRYCKWKQYHSRHYDPAALRRRILNLCPALKLTVYKVQNFKDVSEKCYLRFVGVFEKQQ
jgi:SAM-dependent methyltransferase